ncbi:Class II aldolase/adducin N-terminal [Cynara cardunculus var. scolymus]|uniref:Probable methylthioribulose-1-phosphate dehydratase n=1 Tax=Cynara cardunculus var. scolymus TaxID=59895 RepID=A0A103YJX6_CYNCS|nr:Class II aldolase/adducin N-terminal [Cynara cardunculus var. scolymus]
MAASGVKTPVTSQAYLEGSQVNQTKSLISELCRLFYNLGWVSGTGGSITAKVHDDSVPKSNQIIIMSPSGVQKERMVEEDMYVLSSSGDILFSPLPKPYPHKPPKCSDCAPLFMKAYDKRNAGAVIHSHGMESCLVTMMDPLAKEFRITHMEMIKGIQGHGYYDELVVPIIENTAHERELTESLAKAIEAYPKTTAVLVRNHGVYIWGDSWISAKTQYNALQYNASLQSIIFQAECYHYLFQAAIKLHQLGLDWSTPSHGPIRSSQALRCVVLDIEGTTTPISFVTDVLFPYARDNVRRHLEETYDTGATQEDIELLRSQVQEDLQHGVVDAVPIPYDEDGRHHVIAALVYIYSSGSRLAQRLLFGYSNFGDLRKYLSGFFDTTVGNKKETKSYVEISESLGVHKPSEILFITDIFQEAVAAKAAGLEVVISVRPGNGPLPENHGFKTIKSFSEI